MTNRDLILSAVKALQLEAKTIYEELQKTIETPDVQNYLFLQERLSGIYKRIEINQEALDGYE